MLAFPDDGIPLARNGKHRYAPLELGDDDDDLSFHSNNTSQQNNSTRWKTAFVFSTVLLVPLLVYYIFDKSGLVIVIDKRPPEKPPIITGVAQPKSAAPVVDTEAPTLPNEKPQVTEPTENEPVDTEPPMLPVDEPHITKKPADIDETLDTETPIPPIDEPVEPTETSPEDMMDCIEKYAIDFVDSFQKIKKATVFCVEETAMDKCHCESTVEAAPQSPDRVPTKIWQAAFAKNTELANLAPPDLDVVLLGDSITEHLVGTQLGVLDQEWEQHSLIFEKLFTRQQGGEIDGLALGIAGDRCAQLLYRLQNGELPPNLTPKVFWLLIGTNDLSDYCSAEAILVGIFGIVQEIRKQRPNSKIVINGLLPRPRNSQGTLMGLLWMKSDWINHRLDCYASGSANVEYFDANSIFMEQDGKKLKRDHFEGDWLHPSAVGTHEWGQAIVAKVKQLVNE